MLAPWVVTPAPKAYAITLGLSHAKTPVVREETHSYTKQHQFPKHHPVALGATAVGQRADYTPYMLCLTD